MPNSIGTKGHDDPASWELELIPAGVDRLGLTDHTVIVFTSDHGYHIGEHGLWHKMRLFEQSARVPLFIVAPGVSKKGGVARTPVSLVDIYPALAALCGVTVTNQLQGQSLVPIPANPTATGRGWALTQVTLGENVFGYSLRTSRWRYTEWDHGRRGCEPYDHEADAQELTNLASKPEQADTVANLSAQLRAAVKDCFPADGQMPPLKPGPRAPNTHEPVSVEVLAGRARNCEPRTISGNPRFCVRGWAGQKIAQIPQKRQPVYRRGPLLPRRSWAVT